MLEQINQYGSLATNPNTTMTNGTPSMVARHWLAAALLAVSAIVNAAEPAPIVGHWELVEQPYDLTIEFKPNGVYVALTAMGVMTGRWEVVNETQIATWASDNRPRQVSEYRIVDDMLFITDTAGQQLKHARIDFDYSD